MINPNSERIGNGLENTNPAKILNRTPGNVRLRIEGGQSLANRMQSLWRNSIVGKSETSLRIQDLLR